MICDASATHRVINDPLREYDISARSLSFMRCLVVLQHEFWAVFYSLTNKTHKLNQDIAETRVYISLLPADTSILFSSHTIPTDSILISTLCDLNQTTPLVAIHTQ
jgi:hypothetical protein